MCMEAATHCNSTFTYIQQPRHKGTPFLFLPSFVEKGIKSQSFFTLLALCLITEQSLILAISNSQFSITLVLTEYLHFQDFAMCLFITSMVGYTLELKKPWYMCMQQKELFIWTVGDTCHSAFWPEFGKGKQPGCTYQGQLRHSCTWVGRAWPWCGADPVCSGSQCFCGRGRLVEALISSGFTAHAPVVCGGSAFPGVDNVKCIGNREKGPQNLWRNHSQGADEPLLMAEPGRKAGSRAPFQQKTLWKS